MSKHKTFLIDCLKMVYLNIIVYIHDIGKTMLNMVTVITISLKYKKIQFKVNNLYSYFIILYT